MHGSREGDYKRNNAFSLSDLYGHTLAQEPLDLKIIIKACLFLWKSCIDLKFLYVGMDIQLAIDLSSDIQKSIST